MAEGGDPSTLLRTAVYSNSSVDYSSGADKELKEEGAATVFWIRGHGGRGCDPPLHDRVWIKWSREYASDRPSPAHDDRSPSP
jgi:hypothetical protein